MASQSPELLLELLLTSVYVVVAAALTVGGIAAEYASLQYLGAGEVTVAVWLAVAGAIAIYAGVYGIAYGKLLVRLS